MENRGDTVNTFIRKLYSVYVKMVIRLCALLNSVGLVVFYEPLPQLGIKVDKKRTERSVERWRMIRNEIPSEPLSVLDIGCNTGYYSVNLAEMGHFVTALDNSFFALIVFYAKEALKLNNLSSCSMRLDPDNVYSLPRYDCVLLLSVFHHWCLEYGQNKALSMLDAVYDRADRMLIFETGQTDSASSKYKNALPDMGKDPEKWMHEYFVRKGCAEVRTLGYVRKRHLVLVSK